MNLCCPVCGNLIAMVDTIYGVLYCCHCGRRLNSIQFDTWEARGIPPTNRSPDHPIEMGKQYLFNTDVVNDPTGRFSVCHAFNQAMQTTRAIKSKHKIEPIQVPSWSEMMDSLGYGYRPPPNNGGNPLSRDFWIRPADETPNNGGWWDSAISHPGWGNWPEVTFKWGSWPKEYFYEYSMKNTYEIRKVETVEDFLELKRMGVTVYAHVSISKDKTETGGDKEKDKPVEGQKVGDEAGFERSNGIQLEAWKSYAERKVAETFKVPKEIKPDDKGVQ